VGTLGTTNGTPDSTDMLQRVRSLITHFAINSSAELRSAVLGDAPSAPNAPPWEQHAWLWKHPEASLRYTLLHLAEMARAKLPLMEKHLAEYVPGSAARSNPLHIIMLKPGSNDGDESSFSRDSSNMVKKRSADIETVSAADRWKRCGADHYFAVQPRGAIMRAALTKVALKVCCAPPAQLCVYGVMHNHALAACTWWIWVNSCKGGIFMVSVTMSTQRMWLEAHAYACSSRATPTSG
jgi:hypothetical protein